MRKMYGINDDANARTQPGRRRMRGTHSFEQTRYCTVRNGNGDWERSRGTSQYRGWRVMPVTRGLRYLNRTLTQPTVRGHLRGRPVPLSDSSSHSLSCKNGTHEQTLIMTLMACSAATPSQGRSFVRQTGRRRLLTRRKGRSRAPQPTAGSLGCPCGRRSRRSGRRACPPARRSSR